jgi:hypothetical protein
LRKIRGDPSAYQSCGGFPGIKNLANLESKILQLKRFLDETVRLAREPVLDRALTVSGQDNDTKLWID